MWSSDTFTREKSENCQEGRTGPDSGRSHKGDAESEEDRVRGGPEAPLHLGRKLT